MEVNFSQFLEAGSLRSELLTGSLAGEGPLPGMPSRGLNGLMNRERERVNRSFLHTFLFINSLMSINSLMRTSPSPSSPHSLSEAPPPYTSLLRMSTYELVGGGTNTLSIAR